MDPNVNAFEQDLANFANGKSDGSEPLDRKVVCLEGTCIERYYDSEGNVTDEFVLSCGGDV